MATYRINPIAAAVLGGAIAVVGTAGALTQQKQAAAPAAPASAVALPAHTPAPQVPVASANPNGIQPVSAPNFRAIVQQFGPAVVHVTVEGLHKPEPGEETAADEQDPFFRFFRGLPGWGQGQRGGRGSQSVPFKGQGSGFIVSADGLILTNAHVVREAKEVMVKLQDRREYRAKVLGLDTTTDVAVIKIDAKGLPVVRLGNPQDTQVGDPVLAIGAPFGLEQTATQGIVSAKGRSLPNDTAVPFIQTDAAVNPGNSGGPLFDGAGNVIGINTQIYSQTGGYQGLSFAVPIDMALKIKDQIVAHGHATHARLGVQVQDLNQTLAESFGLERPDGALVAGVARGSAAEKAGLKAGDVITEVNGQRIEQAGQLSSRVALLQPGDTVKLQVWRNKRASDMQVKLGSAEEAKQQLATGGDEADGPKLGLAMRPLSKEEQRQVHTDHGLVIEDVDGPAARAGVAPGDLLLAVNGKPVNSVEEVRAVLKSKPKNVALLIQREGEQLFVPIRLG
jgi:serine protease Do